MIRTSVAALVCLAAATCINAQTTLTGRIVGITDGDTLTLLDDSKQQHRIRLENLDANAVIRSHAALLTHRFGYRIGPRLFASAY